MAGSAILDNLPPMDFAIRLLTPTERDCPEAFIALAQSQGIAEGWAIASTFQRLWFPLAQALHQEQQRLGRPIVLGILGGQGTGKTTLGAMVTALLKQQGHHPLSFSLDDLYLSYGQRQALQAQEPRLKWRGPPGTHDIAQGIQVLDHLWAGQPVAVPRFDKSLWGGAGDQGEPERVAGVDVVIFEGWFVGVRPVDPAVFDGAPEPIVSEGDRAFALAMNAKLADYLPLWERLDRLILLKPVDYRLSYTWRKAAEQRMKAQGKGGMGDQEIEAFVTYFWQALHPELLITPLSHDPQITDAVVEIREDHSIGEMFIPSRTF
ncbi:glycerate kinase [Spirulina sp. CCNP1310]|uniref:glycerate kinase n=1 Tax=Spirulina sp. CCNP1310 TaxID=3110249 RepID=UPI002B1F7D7B|nr:glycerate kinase [Spirulina sp. CCNP1310]MEA5417863.1 glycerate kinase [Spirulina sp. CCNP1310]